MCTWMEREEMQQRFFCLRMFSQLVSVKMFLKKFQFLACTKGFFGQDCAQLCKCPGLETSCDHITGQCECPPGFKGLQCVEVF